MKALVFLEHRGEVLGRGSLGVLGRAAALGGEVHGVVVGGPEAASPAAAAGRFGASVVHVAAAPWLEPPLARPRVEVLAALVDEGGYDTVLFSTSVLAADVAGALAARLDAGLNWDLTDLVVRDGALVGTRPALGDAVEVEVGWRSSPRLALVRPGAFEPVEGGGEAEVRPVAVDAGAGGGGARIVAHSAPADDGPSLEGAEVIVTAGMGLGGAEHLELARRLAEVLGGVVGATRAVVYAGWAPPALQIGQTGKTVAPRLYVALGVSGAVQHRVGMQRAQTVVAVNSDPRAPIFEFCDLAVVADVHSFVPRLVALLRQRQGA